MLPACAGVRAFLGRFFRACGASSSLLLFSFWSGCVCEMSAIYNHQMGFERGERSSLASNNLSNLEGSSSEWGNKAFSLW